MRPGLRRFLKGHLASDHAADAGAGEMAALLR
jgi:hypothetical protein